MPTVLEDLFAELRRLQRDLEGAKAGESPAWVAAAPHKVVAAVELAIAEKKAAIHSHYAQQLQGPSDYQPQGRQL